MMQLIYFGYGLAIMHSVIRVCVCVSACEEEAKVTTMLCRCDLPQEHDPEVLEGAGSQ